MKRLTSHGLLFFNADIPAFSEPTVPKVSVTPENDKEDYEDEDDDDETEVQQQSISYHSDDSSESEDSPAKQLAFITQNNPSIDHSLFDVIPVKEPSLSSIPRKSALKKKEVFTVFNLYPNSASASPVPPPRQDSNPSR